MSTVRIVRARLGVPVVTWLASSLVAWLTAVLSGQNFWDPQARQRWDSQWYLSIATTGYESFRCIDRYPGFPDVWCGNTAWFPGYSMVVRLVAAFGPPAEIAAVVVSEACLLAALVILWQLLGGRLTWHTGAATALAAVFPGSIYFHAVFPVSLGLLGLFVVVLGVRRQSWWLAGTGAFVAFSTHIVGVIGAIAVALSLVFAWRRHRWPGRLWRVGAAVGVGALAYPWTMWMIHAATGSWTIYWDHQRDAFGNAALHDPLEQLLRFWGTPFGQWYPPAADATWLVSHAGAAHQSQLVINLALAGLIAVTALLRAVRRDLAGWEGVAALIALGAFGAPLVTGAWTAWYRHNALMLVGLPVLRLPRIGWVLLIAVCLVQAVFLGAMWFGHSLV